MKKNKAASRRGKFIVIYGINNLGKTTQAKLLVKNLKKVNLKAEYVKYPIYNLEPAGGFINAYLRKGNPDKFTPREFELLHFIDRLKFEPILISKLEKGINIVAEDYFGTAVAWGAGAGVDRKFLVYFYKFIKRENLSFLFDGERFFESIEKNHRYENDYELIRKVRREHLFLSKKYGWKKINANLPIAEIEKIIWGEIKKNLK